MYVCSCVGYSKENLKKHKHDCMASVEREPIMGSQRAKLLKLKASRNQGVAQK